MRKANQIIKDQNTSKEGENQTKIYFLAYELLNPDKNKENLLYESEKFWKFRPIVTFDSMAIELIKETKTYEFTLLKTFSSMLYQLQLLPNLSEIIKLVKFLVRLFNKAIFKTDAKKKAIKDLIDTAELSRGT